MTIQQNKAISESLFEVKNQLSFSKKVFFKNTELEEQLLLTTFLISIIFKKFYLVKMRPIFDGSPLLKFTRYQNFL